VAKKLENKSKIGEIKRFKKRKIKFRVRAHLNSFSNFDYNQIQFQKKGTFRRNFCLAISKTCDQVLFLQYYE